MIDDTGLFEGEDDSPSFDDLVKTIKSNPGYNPLYVEDDIIHVLPKV